MNTHVIILAQGAQKRLPNLPLPKQMLRLPGCGDVPILHRTLRQIWNLMGGVSADDRVTVVTWLPLMEELASLALDVEDPAKLMSLPGCADAMPWTFTPSTTTLIDPGNSSLKGIANYLDDHRRATAGVYERTVVLLGDVVYSWACLRAIFEMTHWRCGFVGTSDLSPSGGELWGVSWQRTAEHTMFSALACALDNHPKFREYQPGQMRRWLWEIDKLIDGPHVVPGNVGQAPRTWYRAIDDYTRDIDLPEHVDMLGQLSAAARDDDAENGVTW